MDDARLSVSRASETVQGEYGTVFFKKNGALCLVRSSFSTNEPLASGTWIIVCTTPAWVAVEDYWLTLRDSQGRNVGIWSINNGVVKIYLHSKPSADNKIVIEGSVLMR